MQSASARHWALPVAMLASSVSASAQDAPDAPPRLLPDVVLAGHTDEVQHAAFSPDGGRIVTDSGYTVRLWDSEGNEVAVLEGHTDFVHGARYSRDGSRIVTASDDGTARL